SIGRPPISTIGFGRRPVSSSSRVPSPPARITVFIVDIYLAPRYHAQSPSIYTLSGQFRRAIHPVAHLRPRLCLFLPVLAFLTMTVVASEPYRGPTSLATA